jgi:UPF0716 protein FxsA
MYVILSLLLLPLLEIAVFILVGNLIGIWPTLALVVLAAVFGASVIRRQGVGAIAALRTRVAAHDDPGGPLFDGAAILFAGVLLLIPGFVSDVLGLMLLSPTVRGALYRALRSRVTVVTAGAPRATRAPQVIDAEYKVLDQDPPRH